MYFLDLKGLIAYLSERRMSSRESYNYLIVFFMMNLPNVILQNHENNSNAGEINVVTDLCIRFGACFVGFIVFYSIIKSYYKSNGGDSGDDFVQNLLAISVVVGLRLSLIFVPSEIFLKLLPEHLNKPLLVFAMTLCLFLMGLGIWGLIQIGRSLRQVRSARLQSSTYSLVER